MQEAALDFRKSSATDLEVDGCEASLSEAEAALGVVPRGFFRAALKLRSQGRRERLRPSRLRIAHVFREPPLISKDPDLMAKTKEPINPFYVLLVLLGIVFFVTAAAYWQMAYRAIPGGGPDAGAGAVPQGEPTTHPLLVFLDERGMELMLCELVLLGLATFGAMALDQYRSTRAARQRAAGQQSGPGEPKLPGAHLSNGTAGDSEADLQPPRR